MNDEKFFEAFSEEKKIADADLEVVLAKAGTETIKKLKVATGEATKKNDYDSEPEGQLTIDVYQTPSGIVVESAVAGVKPEDIDINVTNDSITIRGERHKEKEVKDEDYFYQECYWGKFSRSVILPKEIDPEHATVSFKNGILTVNLPKVNRKKSKKLKVRLE